MNVVTSWLVEGTLHYLGRFGIQFSLAVCPQFDNSRSKSYYGTLSSPRPAPKSYRSYAPDGRKDIRVASHKSDVLQSPADCPSALELARVTLPLVL